MDLNDDNPARAFEQRRPRLLRIAYRMLGVIAEAEDAVQETYLRWHQTDRSAVRDAEAVLVRTVTRVCLDILKSARVRREQYVGTWLPEPVMDVVEGEDLTLSLMMALERLSPLERAAFLLHDVFGQDFDVVAAALERDPAACRQLASRARTHVREARPRFPITERRGHEIASAFFDASRNGDVNALKALLAHDAVAYTDGGGKVSASLVPICGQANVMQFFADLHQRLGPDFFQCVYQGLVDGLPAMVAIDPRGGLQITALGIEEGRIVEIYVVRNPDKLEGVRRFLG
ncbi:sigma-70 family RNA polymerase sigma factor [Pendulispora rubella]|uniref:Sigma-70 family RNA polymerase sigma factor n=1 Tax=Pendulispora rubella TaxID=2741070 RepID=A0ABZ2L4Q8_9BACT